MSRALIVVNSRSDRDRIVALTAKAPWGTRVEFKAAKRTLPQNDRMWAMLTDVASQLSWHGRKMKPDSWKLMFLDALCRAKGEALDIVPNLDGTGFVNLSTSSSDLSKDEMTDLIEIIFEFGARHDVKFLEPDARAA